MQTRRPGLPPHPGATPSGGAWRERRLHREKGPAHDAGVVCGRDYGTAAAFEGWPRVKTIRQKHDARARGGGLRHVRGCDPR